MEILILTQTVLKFALGSFCIAAALKLTYNRNKLGTGELGSELTAGKDGIQLSKNHQLSKEASQAHIALFAPTRAGKTTNVIFSNLLQDCIRGSILVYDPAGEIYDTTHKYQRKIGRRVIVYNPLNPGGIEYNLLDQCTQDREVVQLAQSLLINGSLSIELPTGKKAGGIEWLQMAQNLLAACLFYAKDRKQSIKYAIQLLIENTEEDLSNKFVGKAQDYYKAYMSGADAMGMQGSIKGTMTSNLGVYLDDLAIRYTSFTAEMLRNEECIVYIQYPEHMAYYLAPLMAPIYTQLINRLIEIKGLPQWFILDEFANLGQLTGFNVAVSTAAKRGICFLLCLQDFNQLRQVYGHDNALTIWNNCKTKVALPGLSDIDTLKMLSTLCDDEEIEIYQEEKKVKSKKPLFTSGEVRRITKGKCLIISDNFQPILDETNYYKNNQQYLLNMEG